MPKVTYWILVGSIIVYTFFVFLPEFLLPSIGITWFAGGAAIIGFICSVFANYFQNRFLRMIGGVSISLLLFTWSLRAWMYLYDWSWYVATLLFAGLILTGLVPFINYHFADALYREGFAPRTKLGKAIQRISLALIPSVGVLGALFGLNSKTSPTENMPILWIFAIGFYVVPASAIFNSTTEYASKRPYLFSPWSLWRKQEKRTRRGKND